MSAEPGGEVGGQQGGKFHRCGLFFQIKRASDNIKQKAPTALPVVRCRCAREADEGSMSKLHLFGFLRGILHCLL